MRDEHDRGARVTAPVVDELDDRLLVREVERQQRLVAQQHLAVADERLRDAEALLLTAREQTDRRIGVGLGADRRGSRRRPRAPARVPERQAAPMTVEPEAHEIATADREDAVERMLLRHVPDVVTPPLRRPAVDLHVAVRQPGQTEQYAQQRRLARAVRAEHRDELPRRDVEIEMLEQACARRSASPRRAARRHAMSALSFGLADA